MRVLYALLVLAIVVIVMAGCHPRSHGADQVTLRLPQSTLSACPCNCPCGTQPCTCPAGQCQCADCPGKSSICPSRESAVASAKKFGCKIAAFVNQPAREVAGCVSYSVPDSTNPAKRLWMGDTESGVYLGETPMYQAPAFLMSGNCSGGRCR